MLIYIKYEYFEILDHSANVATKLYNTQLDIILAILVDKSTSDYNSMQQGRKYTILSQLDYFKQNKPFQYKLYGTESCLMCRKAKNQLCLNNCLATLIVIQSHVC